MSRKIKKGEERERPVILNRKFLITIFPTLPFEGGEDNMNM